MLCVLFLLGSTLNGGTGTRLKEKSDFQKEGSNFKMHKQVLHFPLPWSSFAQSYDHAWDSLSAGHFEMPN